MSKQEEPRCVACRARYVALDDEGLCQACFVTRGLRTMAECQQEEPHREHVTGERLAAIIAAAAARMSPVEQHQLWLECYQLMGDKLDSETHPELCAAINALTDPVPEEARAAKWN